jgi:hypothetical protein
MQLALQLICWAIGLPLGLLAIGALLRGGYRLFPVLFVYEIVDLLMTVAGMPPYIAYYFQHQPAARALMAQWSFWDDLLLLPLVLAVVIGLIFSATKNIQSRRMMRAASIGYAALVAGVSFFIHYGPEMPKGVWMALWIRDLNFFGSAVLDLALWTLLLWSRSKDSLLLLVSGGLGIQFTGEAIGDSLRSMAVLHRSKTLSFTGSLITTIVDLLSVYIIWQAFRNYNNSKNAKRAAV